MARITKAQWISKGLDVLSEEGYHAIHIDILCDKFKITKGSFYHHFDSLEDYEKKLLKHWEKETLAGLNKALDKVESPEAKLFHMVDWVFSVSGTLELSLRAWALHNKLVKKLVVTMDLKRISTVTDMYMKIGVPRKEARELAELGHAAWIGIQTCYIEGVIDRERSRQHINDMVRTMVKDLLRSKKK